MGVTVGRSQEIERARDALAREDRYGVVIAGAPGVGTSHVAARAAERSADPATTRTARTSRAVHDALADERVDLVVVDPATVLDDATAEALVHAADEGSVRAVLTHRPGASLADPVEVALRAGRFERVEVGPLDRVAMGDLAQQLAGRRLTPDTTDRLVGLAAGLPLHLRELVTATLETGGFRDLGDALFADELPVGAPRLLDLAVQQLDGLPESVREALEVIAAVEPVSAGVLGDLVAASMIEDLRTRGFVTVELDERRADLRLTRPLLGATIRATRSPLWLRDVRNDVGATIRALGANRVDDRARLAVWSLDGCDPVDVDALVTASRRTFAAGEHRTSLRLARAAFDRDRSFETGRVLEAPVYELGDRHEIEEFFEHWTPLATTDQERATLLNCHAAARYWRLGDTGGVATMLGAADEMPEGEHADGLRAAAASYLVTMGDVTDAVRIGEPLLHASPGRAQIHATLATGHGWRASGRPNDAVAVLDKVMAAYRAAGPESYVVSHSILANIGVQALAEAGDFDGAERAAAESFEVGRVADSPTGLGLAHLALGWAGVLQGLGERAESNLSDARYWLERARHPGLVRWALIARALGRLQRNDLDGGVALRRELDRVGDHPAQLFESTLARVDARISHGRGHPDAAVRMLTSAAHRDLDRGNVVGAIGCWHDLARLGRAADAAAQLDRIDETRLQGELLAVHVAHIRALAARDPDALLATIDECIRVGLVLVASETAMFAAAAASERRDSRGSARLLEQAAELAASIGLAGVERPEEVVVAGLSDREWEVARLAARGMSSREIGERLFISARTVDNHLGRVYGKLGVSDRRALAHKIAS